MAQRTGALEALVTASQETLDAAAWRDRRVLLTGHTGFKGAWMSLLLEALGAQVAGAALNPATEPHLFGLFRLADRLDSAICDMRDLPRLRERVRAVRPQVVIHMAAQALVRDSYHDPLGTFASNVMGTAHLLDSLRSVEGLQAVLVITSDKVYENTETGTDFPEQATLGGYDPYSASKAATEILTAAYRRSFFAETGVPVMTARAGNVIGGGDWSRDRLIPDLWRAHQSGCPVLIRNPRAVRPWQHVLDPLHGYLMLLQRALRAPEAVPFAVNFGPPREPIRTVVQVAEIFAATLGIAPSALWAVAPAPAVLHESGFLAIDSTLASQTLGWRTALPVDEAVRWTCDWYRAFADRQDMLSLSRAQLRDYVALSGFHAAGGSLA